MQTVAERVTNNYSLVICGILRLQQLNIIMAVIPFFYFLIFLVANIVAVVMIFNKREYQSGDWADLINQLRHVRLVPPVFLIIQKGANEIYV